MTIKRLDHVSVVVDDLAAATAFFTALGMTLEGKAPIEGPWVDRIKGLEGRTGDRTAEHAGPPERHVYSRKRRRHCRSPARQRRRTRRRGGPVRGQVQTLLHARPCRHHRRAGRGTLLKRSRPWETGGPQAFLRLDPLVRNRPLSRVTSAAVLLVSDLSAKSDTGQR